MRQGRSGWWHAVVVSQLSCSTKLLYTWHS